jgi:hypothetical protein
MFVSMTAEEQLNEAHFPLIMDIRKVLLLTLFSCLDTKKQSTFIRPKSHSLHVTVMCANKARDGEKIKNAKDKSINSP